MLSVLAFDSHRAANVLRASQSGVKRTPGCREDVLNGPGLPTLHRFLIDARGPREAAKAIYVVSLGDAWLVAEALPRDPDDRLDVEAIDRLLRGLLDGAHAWPCKAAASFHRR